MHDSRSERYLLITLDLPDGSDGTPDPEATTERIRQHVYSALRDDEGGDLSDLTDVSFRVEDAYYGDIVGDWDPES